MGMTIPNRPKISPYIHKLSSNNVPFHKISGDWNNEITSTATNDVKKRRVSVSTPSTRFELTITKAAKLTAYATPHAHPWHGILLISTPSTPAAKIVPQNSKLTDIISIFSGNRFVAMQ